MISANNLLFLSTRRKRERERDRERERERERISILMGEERIHFVVWVNVVRPDSGKTAKQHPKHCKNMIYMFFTGVNLSCFEV